jgi:hypothetical protein
MLSGTREALHSGFALRIRAMATAKIRHWPRIARRPSAYCSRRSAIESNALALVWVDSS